MNICSIKEHKGVCGTDTCIAGGDFDYDVIWKSMNKYLVNNNFTWRPMYQIFGTNTFEDEVKVEVSMNTQNIGLGEKTILDKSGLLSTPITGGIRLDAAFFS